MRELTWLDDGLKQLKNETETMGFLKRTRASVVDDDGCDDEMGGGMWPCPSDIDGGVKAIIDGATARLPTVLGDF